MKTFLTLQYILITLIILMLAGLLGWYFFIRAKQGEIERTDASRGAGLAESFAGRVGSTYENIVGTLGSNFTSAPVSEDGSRLPRLSQVNKTPTAGVGFFANDLPAQAGTSTRLRFVERSTGYVFDADPETLALERRTATLMPRVYEALVATDGRMIMRTMGEGNAVVTIAASLATGTPSAENPMALVQTLLSPGIRSIVASPTGKEILYIVEGEGGGTGIKATWDGRNPKQVFSSAIAGWETHWLPDDRIVLVQKPSDGVGGYAYELRKDGSFSPLVESTAGLTLLPRSSPPAILYGASTGGLALSVRISGTSTSAALPIRTVAEKCVWAPDSERAPQGKPLIAYCAVPQTQPPVNFLDRWHRGEIHTSDAWWRIDASAASAELLLSPGNVTIDVEDPVIDEGGRYIAFINARDKSLWLLRIEE